METSGMGNGKTAVILHASYLFISSFFFSCILEKFNEQNAMRYLIIMKMRFKNGNVEPLTGWFMAWHTTIMYVRCASSAPSTLMLSSAIASFLHYP